MSTPEQRFEQILDRYGRLLRAAIRRTLPAWAEAEIDDVEQEARLRILRALRDERTIEENPRYLHRIAVTTALDAIRRIQRRREDALMPGDEGSDGVPHRELASPAPAPDRILAGRRDVEAVRRCLETLVPRRRRVVHLHLLGWKPPESARLLGWTGFKVRNLVYRGLRDLRRCLERRDAGS